MNRHINFVGGNHIISNSSILAKRLRLSLCNTLGKLRVSDIVAFYRKEPGFKSFLEDNNIELRDFIYDIGEKECLFWIEDDEAPTLIINGIFLLRRFIESRKGLIFLVDMEEFYNEYYYMESIINYKGGPKDFVDQYGEMENIFYVEEPNQGDYICFGPSFSQKNPEKSEKQGGRGDIYRQANQQSRQYENPKSGSRDIFSDNFNQPRPKIEYMNENKPGSRPNDQAWKKPVRKNWHNDNLKRILKDALPGENPINPRLPAKIKLPSTSGIPPAFLKYLQKAEVISDFKLQKSTLKVIEKSYGAPPKPDELASFFKKFDLVEFLRLQRDLLFAEEVQMIADLNKYDLEDALIQKENKRFYRINIPGLAEKRPSVIRGDQIIIKIQDKDDIVNTYFSFVWVVNLDHVLVSLHPSLKDEFYMGDVHFTHSRGPLFKMHKALERFSNDPKLLELLQNQNHFLYSLDLDVKGISINPNELQRRTLSMCLSSMDTPSNSIMVIFGPPGTGKTSTLIECILQIINKNPSSKILACTPSNEAADLICSRLLEFLNKMTFRKLKITRLIAMMRDPKLVPEEIKNNCNLNYEDGVFKPPVLETIKSSDIIVSTNIVSWVLHDNELSQNTFSHIFVDEAGEALLAETLIPLTLKGKDTTIILAGDPKQLGPIVRSPVCESYLLGISLLEILIAVRSRDLKKGEDNPLSLSGKGVFYLNENYRAHEHIIELYNSLFYQGNLRCKSDRAVVDQFIGVKWLITPKVPVIFRHVKGKEEREYDSPSWFNMSEVSELFTYVERLLKMPGVGENDIGIISPYRKQRDKIKKYFSEKKTFDNQYNAIRVGTTESFQGSEKKIIIVTCVRSQETSLAYDKKFNIGFITSPKRINVAISRAQSLLIILGNALVLSTDPLFKRLIQSIQRIGGYEGPDLPSDPSDRNPVSLPSKAEELASQENIHPRNYDLEWRDMDN